jgi:hypothetical protein
MVNRATALALEIAPTEGVRHASSAWLSTGTSSPFASRDPDLWLALQTF